ncbi:MAG TPA: hypothetical protein VHY76_15810 [Acetobacteraceae bacterium]|jgi:hypothetical protein|nr:hypothetical protein [Acetobacteraceae bacterium]
MSPSDADPGDRVPKEGPALTREIHEVQAIFPSDATLQEAMAQLAVAGHDRADFSLPATTPPASEATPEHGAAEPYNDDDNRQIRTLHASGVGSAAALAAAGVVIGTGGAAAPAVGAALAAGAGGAALTEAGSHAADAAQHEAREAAAREGRLVLSVRLRDPARADETIEIMRRAGATRAEVVRRVDNAIDSASWTG